MYGSWPPSIDPQQQGSTRSSRLPLSLQQKGLAASPSSASTAPQADWLAGPSVSLPAKQASTRLPPLNTLDYNSYHAPSAGGSLFDQPQSQPQSVPYQQHPPSHRQFYRQEYKSWLNPHHPPEKEPQQEIRNNAVNINVVPADHGSGHAGVGAGLDLAQSTTAGVFLDPNSNKPFPAPVDNSGKKRRKAPRQNRNGSAKPVDKEGVVGSAVRNGDDTADNNKNNDDHDDGTVRQSHARAHHNPQGHSVGSMTAPDFGLANVSHNLSPSAVQPPASLLVPNNNHVQPHLSSRPQQKQQQQNRNQARQANNCNRKTSSRTPSGATTVSSVSTASSTPSSTSLSRNATRLSSGASLPTTVSSTSTPTSSLPSKIAHFNSFRPRSPSDVSLDDPATLGPRTHGKRLTVKEETELFGICNKYAATFGERNQICAWYAKIGDEFTSRMDHQYSWHSVRRKVEDISRQQLALKEKRDREGRSHDADEENNDPKWRAAVLTWLPTWKKYVDQETERINMNQGKRGRKRKNNGPGFTPTTTEGSESPSTTEPSTSTPDFPFPMIPDFGHPDGMFSKATGVGNDMTMGDATATTTSESSATATAMGNTAASNTSAAINERIPRSVSNPAGISSLTRPDMAAITSSSATPAALTAGSISQMQPPLGPAPTTSSTGAYLAWPRMNKSLNSTSSSSPIINPSVSKSLWPHGPYNARQQEQQTRHASLSGGPTSFSPGTQTHAGMDSDTTRQGFRAQGQNQNQHQHQQQQQTPGMRIHPQTPTPLHGLSRSMDITQAQARPHASYGRQSSHQFMMPQPQMGATPSSSSSGPLQLHPSIMTPPNLRLSQYQKPHQQQQPQMHDNSRHVSAPLPQQQQQQHPAMGLYPYQTNSNNNNNPYLHHSYSQSHSFPHPHHQSQATNQLPNSAISLPPALSTTTAAATGTGTSSTPVSATFPGHTPVAASATPVATHNTAAGLADSSSGGHGHGGAAPSAASPLPLSVPGSTLTQIRLEVRHELKREMDRDRVQWEQKLDAMERDRSMLVQKLQHLENAQSMILTQLLRPNME